MSQRTKITTVVLCHELESFPPSTTSNLTVSDQVDQVHENQGMLARTKGRENGQREMMYLISNIGHI